MKKRLLRKIVKKYGDSWWVGFDSPTRWVSYLKPPGKWNTQRVLDEFHRQHIGPNGYRYKISVPFPITGIRI